VKPVWYTLILLCVAAVQAVMAQRMQPPQQPLLLRIAWFLTTATGKKGGKVCAKHHPGKEQ
jgi:hypothetical protein